MINQFYAPVSTKGGYARFRYVLGTPALLLSACSQQDSLAEEEGFEPPSESPR